MILLLKATNGLGFPCIHIGINTLILQNTEGSFIGRVGGVLTPMFMGMMVVGMALAGYLKDAFAVHGVFNQRSIVLHRRTGAGSAYGKRRTPDKKQAQG
ncbi:hypothetical protein YDYSG_45430 [Paenibacillus tyrfis]|nr:hypothetical protein YDYSG_45430 [Paenibacillus tyrfis]